MAETSNTQRRFDVLFGTLCEILSGLLDSTAKVAGFLLLITGWIATSDTAQKFLRSDELSRRLVVTSLGGAFALYFAASLGAFAVSRRTLSLLNNLGFMPSDYYEGRAVDIRMLAVFLLGNLFLAALATGLVLQMR